LLPIIQIGATVAKNSASSTQVHSLLYAAERMGRKISIADAKAAIYAMNNAATLFTADRQVWKFMRAYNYPFISL